MCSFYSAFTICDFFGYVTPNETFISCVWRDGKIRVDLGLHDTLHYVTDNLTVQCKMTGWLEA